MASIKSWFSPLSSTRRHLVAIGATLALLGFGIGGPLIASAGRATPDAERLRQANTIVRTNMWLEEHNLDRSSSVDMKKALDLACKERKARGLGC